MDNFLWFIFKLAKQTEGKHPAEHEANNIKSWPLILAHQNTVRLSTRLVWGGKKQTDGDSGMNLTSSDFQ